MGLKMGYKTHKKTEADKISEEILNKLYHLEDLNSYRKNKLNRVIEMFKNIKWEQEVLK